ncbi:hypothetical protein V2J09_013113 [Rumex salicifolius]
MVDMPIVKEFLRLLEDNDIISRNGNLIKRLKSTDQDVEHMSEEEEEREMDGPLRGRGRNKRYWTAEEDDILIQSLLELSQNGKWKGESGFKSGYMNKLKEMISKNLPTCGLKAEPHIDSRLKHWLEKYYTMAEMLGISGFGWDDVKNVLQVERTVFDEWIKNHKKSKGLYGVPFPHYDILAEIYGNDRATGEASESFVLAKQNIDEEISLESITIDSEDDIDVETESESMQSGSGASGASGSSKRKNLKIHVPKGKKQKMKRRYDEISVLPSSLNTVSMEFGKVFEDMNAHLGAMVQVWGGEEERKKKLDNESNKILEEVLKLEVLSPSDALEVVTVLMAEEHKLRVFYQATTAM